MRGAEGGGGEEEAPERAELLDERRRVIGDAAAAADVQSLHVGPGGGGIHPMGSGRVGSAGGRWLWGLVGWWWWGD